MVDTDDDILELWQVVDDGITIPVPTSNSEPEPEPEANMDANPSGGPTDEKPKETISQKPTSQKLTSEEPEKTMPHEAQIWAFLGVAGGVGVTSLAVQTAWQLAQEKSSVCLVDLDFERGDCAAYLDVAPALEIADLNDAEGRMDEDLAQTFVRKTLLGVSMISAKAELGGNDLVSPGALLSLLDSISGLFDYVILDVPPMWRGWTQAAIGAADKFALVTEARVPALHQAKRMSAEISGAMDLAHPPQFILNKSERRTLQGGLSLADVQKVLGTQTCLQICTDEDTVRTAINAGKPAGVVKPNSRYAKSVHAFVDDWTGKAADAQSKRQTKNVGKKSARTAMRVFGKERRAVRR